MWVSLRLRGMQPIDLNDLLLFARALDVEVHDLMPPPEIAAKAVGSGLTAKYPAVAVRSAFGDRPRDNRPNGRAVAATAPAGGRTTYLDRPRRRRKDR